MELAATELPDTELPTRELPELYVSKAVVEVLLKYISKICGPGHAKMCLMPYANNKGAD